MSLDFRERHSLQQTYTFESTLFDALKVLRALFSVKQPFLRILRNENVKYWSTTFPSSDILSLDTSIFNVNNSKWMTSMIVFYHLEVRWTVNFRLIMRILLVADVVQMSEIVQRKVKQKIFTKHESVLYILDLDNR